MHGRFAPPSAQLKLKYRAAREAGLLDRVMEVGWAGLSAKESGKIGGILAHMVSKEETDV
ncbi:MAG: small acid-soluble spore protein alpha/beta type [Clostridia bacterium]|nr:small acid-soluble spore protein alpha/beta type [Clostridia bacterium]